MDPLLEIFLFLLGLKVLRENQEADERRRQAEEEEMDELCREAGWYEDE